MNALSAGLRALVNQNAISLEQAAGMMPLPNNNPSTPSTNKGKPRPIIIPTPALRLAIATVCSEPAYYRPRLGGGCR